LINARPLLRAVFALLESAGVCKAGPI
jgi:hypothetical protein